MICLTTSKETIGKNGAFESLAQVAQPGNLPTFVEELTLSNAEVDVTSCQTISYQYLQNGTRNKLTNTVPVPVSFDSLEIPILPETKNAWFDADILHDEVQDEPSVPLRLVSVQNVLRMEDDWLDASPVSGEYLADLYRSLMTTETTTPSSEQDTARALAKLKNSIQSRRRRAGLAEIPAVPEFRQSHSQLSPEDVARRVNRRLCNKMAAAKCRANKALKEKELEMNKTKLELSNKEVEELIQQLSAERTLLEKTLANHSCVYQRTN